MFSLTYVRLYNEIAGLHYDIKLHNYFMERINSQEIVKID